MVLPHANGSAVEVFFDTITGKLFTCFKTGLVWVSSCECISKRMVLPVFLGNVKLGLPCVINGLFAAALLFGGAMAGFGKIAAYWILLLFIFVVALSAVVGFAGNDDDGFITCTVGLSVFNSSPLAGGNCDESTSSTHWGYWYLGGSQIGAVFFRRFNVEHNSACNKSFVHWIWLSNAFAGCAYKNIQKWELLKWNPQLSLMNVILME